MQLTANIINAFVAMTTPAAAALGVTGVLLSTFCRSLFYNFI